MAPPTVEKLVAEFFDSVFRFSYRLSGTEADASDLAQETFCTAAKRLHQLREPDKARAWLLQIARNHYLLGKRRQGGRSSAPADDLADPKAAEAGTVLVQSTEADRLRAALAELPEAYRVPTVLFYFEGLSYKDIAEALNVPIGTVMSRLTRARERLRHLLGDDPI